MAAMSADCSEGPGNKVCLREKLPRIKRTGKKFIRTDGARPSVTLRTARKPNGPKYIYCTCRSATLFHDTGKMHRMS